MRHENETVAAVSFDLFGTLVTVDRPSDPAESLAHALEEQGVSVPDDWTGAFGERHIDNPDGAEISLTDHVVAALASQVNTLKRASVRDDVERAVWSVYVLNPGAELPTTEDARTGVRIVATAGVLAFILAGVFAWL